MRQTKNEKARFAGTIFFEKGERCRWFDGDSDASEDGRMGIEGDAGGGNGNYGKSSASGPGGLVLDLDGRDACGDGSDGDGGKDGRIGLEADSGAVSEVEGSVDDAIEAAAAAAAIGPGPGGDEPLVALDKKKKKNGRHDDDQSAHRKCSSKTQKQKNVQVAACYIPTCY